MDRVRQEKIFNRIIIILAVLIPVVVALLFGVNLPQLGFDVKPLTQLPAIYASINFITVILLVGALIAVLNKKINLHITLIMLAMFCSFCFLSLYILYHMTSPATPYGGQGIWRLIYFGLLISHICLSIVVIPVVLLAFARGWLRQIAQHKKLVKVALPLWLYVASSGVLIYLMISPYYGRN